MYEDRNAEQLITSAKELNWKGFYESNDINVKVDIFNGNYYHLFNHCVPIINVKLRTQSKPWFDAALNDDLKLRHESYEKYRQCNDGNRVMKLKLKNEYRTVCKVVKNKINFLKRKKLEGNIRNAKTNKWAVLKTLGANRERTNIGHVHNFDVNELNAFYFGIHSSTYKSENERNCQRTELEFKFQKIAHGNLLHAMRKVSSIAVGMMAYQFPTELHQLFFNDVCMVWSSLVFIL